MEIPHKLQKKTGRKSREPPQFLRGKEYAIIRLKLKTPSCVEEYGVYPQLGRFNLRDEGITIAIGKIMKIVTNEVFTKKTGKN
jgi:peptide chain release factor subunit 3